MTSRATALARALLMGTCVAAAAAGCSSRPTEEACSRAIANIRELTGQSHTDVGADRSATIRACRAQSSAKTVECMIEAQTPEELYACGGALAERLKKEAAKQEAERAKDAPPTPAPATPPATDPAATDPAATDPATDPAADPTATDPAADPTATDPAADPGAKAPATKDPAAKAPAAEPATP